MINKTRIELLIPTLVTNNSASELYKNQQNRFCDYNLVRIVSDKFIIAISHHTFYKYYQDKY